VNAREVALERCALGGLIVPVDRYARGRVALLGDAAWGGTLGGQGSGLALVGAYVLAGELARAGGDHARAFARYESHMRSYADSCQAGSRHVGGFYAPKTRAGYWLRNTLYAALVSRPLMPLFERMVTNSAGGISLPEYVA
jgi:2-polyprenyl-6-methoxyphenol hydroxylase-like FAD-dependent oxidoreductase